MEERLPIWRVGANVLNKLSRTADMDGPPAWGLGEMLTNSHRVTKHELLPGSWNETKN
jgi:hypothetical protein